MQKVRKPSRHPFAPFAPPLLQGFRKIALQVEKPFMSSRPWLKALKATIRERGTDTDETQEKAAEALSLEGCERCESPADVPPSVVDIQPAEKLPDSWGEEERRLIDADWKPKKRSGKIIWERPDNGFYVSKEIAVHFLACVLTRRARDWRR